MSLHIETPLLESAALKKIVGGNVYLKMEALQPSGSFKLRGIGHACETYAARGATRFVASSGGNAGMAVAYCGRKLNIPVTIVVPSTTPGSARERILLEGAELIVYGNSWFEAHGHAQTLLTGSCAYIHPFDDPLLWDGHESLIDEVAAAGVIPDAVVLSVGGGGLLCGIMQGLAKHAWNATRVIAVETLGAESFARALAAGHTVDLPTITSIATSLGCRRVSEEALSWSRRWDIRSMVVTDEQAVTATQRFLFDQRQLVEPACGAALAAIYENAPDLRGAKDILVVVCGGVVIRPTDVAWLH